MQRFSKIDSRATTTNVMQCYCELSLGWQAVSQIVIFVKVHFRDIDSYLLIIEIPTVLLPFL